MIARGVALHGFFVGLLSAASLVQSSQRIALLGDSINEAGSFTPSGSLSTIISLLRNWLAVLAVVGAVTTGQAQQGETWKTVFTKRGFCGPMEMAWAGSLDATLRIPIEIPVDGSKVRVHLATSHADDFTLEKMSFVKAADRDGHVEGAEYPVLFSGSAAVEIPARSAEILSDEMEIPLTKGLWILQQKYATQKCLYAYDADGYFSVPPEGEPQFKKHSLPGNVSQIDILSPDPRPVIVCWGDSITQGYGSSAGTDHRYPSLLGKSLNQPVVNLGVNGDQAIFSKGIPSRITTLEGAETVIYLMGINDILTGSITTAKEYEALVGPVLDAVKRGGRRFYLGTILPAKGHEKFDADPAKENLRQEINAWIRDQSGRADGVIDFDEALRDPSDPAKMKEEFQSDWLHPNDAGYRKMAEVAAKVLQN
ncbi:MAG: hypothetical protein IAE94_13500 [Chthoniobacterales bacterium]|nr:hypothetical protein [Chthoniobacterales bacterium]